MLDTFRHNRPLYLSNVRRDSTCTTTTNSTFGSLTQRSYSSTYKQAVSIYKAIQFSHPNMLTEECTRKCLFAWENNPGSTVTEISSLMQRLVNTTELDTRKISLDDALVHAYSKNENMATVVCPEFALLVAVHYIHRLKMKYQDVVGAHGCSRRLVMIAFLVAVKYIHSSLRLIVEPSFKSPATTESSFLQSHMKLSTERSTLQALSDTTASSSFQCKSGSRNSHAQKQPFVELIKEYVPESTIERMELEFLHFLNYDLRLSDPMRLVTWAQEQHTSNQQAQYTSGDEAGDEMDDETTDDDE